MPYEPCPCISSVLHVNRLCCIAGRVFFNYNTFHLTLISSQAIRQTVRLIEMDHPQGVLRTGDRATVQFEFISHPEFVKEGMKLLFREGKTKVS